MNNYRPNNLEHIKSFVALGTGRTERLINLFLWRKSHFDVTGEHLTDIVIDNFWYQDAAGGVAYINDAPAKLGTVVSYSDYEKQLLAAPMNISISLTPVRIGAVHCLTERCCDYCGQMIGIEDCATRSAVKKGMHEKCAIQRITRELFDEFFHLELTEDGIVTRLRSSKHERNAHVNGIHCSVSTIPNPHFTDQNDGAWFRVTVMDKDNKHCVIEIGKEKPFEQFTAKFTHHGTMFASEEEMYSAIHKYLKSCDLATAESFTVPHESMLVQFLAGFFSC